MEQTKRIDIDSARDDSSRRNIDCFTKILTTMSVDTILGESPPVEMTENGDIARYSKDATTSLVREGGGLRDG